MYTHFASLIHAYFASYFYRKTHSFRHSFFFSLSIFDLVSPFVRSFFLGCRCCCHFYIQNSDGLNTFVALFFSISFFFFSRLPRLFNRNRDAYKYTESRQLQSITLSFGIHSVNKFIQDFGRRSRISDEHKTKWGKKRHKLFLSLFAKSCGVFQPPSLTPE